MQTNSSIDSPTRKANAFTMPVARCGSSASPGLPGRSMKNIANARLPMMPTNAMPTRICFMKRIIP